MFIERRVYVMERHFAGRQRYVDISFQNNVMTQAIFNKQLPLNLLCPIESYG